MGRRLRFADDCDAWHDFRAVMHADERARRDELYSVLRAGRRHYPNSQSLRKRWVRARLALGSARPKVRIGATAGAALRFPRTTREAAFT